MRIIFSVFFFVVFIVLCSPVTVFAVADSNNIANLEHKAINWKKLKYEASAFFVTVSTKINLSKVSKVTAGQDLLSLGEEAANSPSENVIKLVSKSKKFSKRTKYSLLFNEKGEALQRKRIRSGKKNDIRIYRYAGCGYRTFTKKFAEEDFDKNFNSWSTIKGGVTQFSEEQCEGNFIVDTSSLIYLVSALPLEKAGDRISMLSVAKNQLIKLTLTVKRKTDIWVDYNDIEDDVDVLEIKLHAETLVGKKPKKLKFLGLKKKIRFYVDPVTRLILRISGKADVVGDIDINLKRAVF